ncbi:2-oxo acid dehydrogenase acyltransferase, partial [Ostertagia ostertagi]
ANLFPYLQFKLSDIGEGIAEVQIKEWHVKEGDTVSQFDNLCEVQSDKAAVTITSRYDGVIKKLHYKVDDVARVGQPLVEIEVDEAIAAEETSEEPKKDESEAPKAEAPSAAPTTAPRTSSDSEAPTPASPGKVLATPAVRRVAMENKVDLRQVKGSGRDGRVLKEDVLKFLGQVKEDYTSGSTNIRYSPAIATQAKVVRISSGFPASILLFSFLGLVFSVVGGPRCSNPWVYSCNDQDNDGGAENSLTLVTMMRYVCADALIAVRKELKELAKERNVKLSYMPFFIKAASLALLEYPSLNASVDEKLENVIYKASHNICLAMDTPGGLVVPNIKNCEQRSILEIAAELQRLQEDGKRERIAREDLAGGTFTISNIGTIGGTYVSPVIFPPQVAIGALGKVEKLPRYDEDDNLVPMNMFKVSWCADHRVVDGATMARFSNRWKFYVEHPSAMLAQLK